MLHVLLAVIKNNKCKRHEHILSKKRYSEQLEDGYISKKNTLLK